MANYSLPWDDYYTLMGCHLVALDKRPGVRHVGIRETLHQSIAKLVMRAAEDQANTTCGRLQLCTGLEVGIEGETNAVAQRRQEITVLVPGYRAGEALEEGSILTEDDIDRDGE